MKRSVLASALILTLSAIAPGGVLAHSPKMPVPKVQPSPRKKSPIRLQPVRSRKQHRPVGGPAFPSLLGLLTLNGCADLRKAGSTCPDIDYLPTGLPPYDDSAFDDIRDACRPDRITEWDSLARGPTLSSSCETAILDLLPLEISFATGTVGKGVDARRSLAHGFHALLFMPLADTGDIFSSTDEADYCPNIYGGYLFARADTLEPRTLTNAGYDSGFDQMNIDLARFILERMGEFRFETGDGSYEAREDHGDIVLTESFADDSQYLLKAGVLLHESRHNSTGFPDGSDHVPCKQGLFKGDSECDDSMFGAYGSHISYLDSVLKGSIVATLEDGTPLLTESDFKTTVHMACTLHQNAINEPQGALVDLFQGVECDHIADDPVGFAETIFGIPADQVQLR